MEKSNKSEQSFVGGSIYSDTSNYDMLNSSVFTPLNFTDTKTELAGGNIETEQYSEFSQMSEFNIDKLFEDNKMVDGIFSQTTNANNADLTDIEKEFEQQMGGFSATSSYNLNMLGGGSEFSATSSCK